ncbi:Bromodomain adjacent to zinc finger domain 1A [Quillaja saponaria]|uniref:Bromodomain adjacent to zinc finger domain 1A n=1 Tax=Quillaja saponaria TaxID=32244 RepID=A0AAD7PP81_QUISA|nr:Bromodomain adjacent to zinc finger domain 1A [Quillaja saponaria]
MGAKIYKVGPYRDRPHHSCPNTFCFYEDYLKVMVRYPFHPFIVKELNALGIYHAQITPNGWRFLITFIGVCHTLYIRLSLTVFRNLHQIKNKSGGGYIFLPGSTCTKDIPTITNSGNPGTSSLRLLAPQASLYTKLKKAQEDVEYSTDKLLDTIQENENLKTRLIQAEKAEAEGRAAFEHFESLQIKEEKDDEIARLRAKLEVSKEEAWTAVKDFKNSNDCQKMIYDHGSRLYANGCVGCRAWLKECNLFLNISEAKWPGEEEAEEEERLAKMLAEAEADQDEGSEDESDTDEEVEDVESDRGNQ